MARSRKGLNEALLDSSGSNSTIPSVINKNNQIIYGPGSSYKHVDPDTWKNILSTGLAVGSNLATLLIYFAGAYNIKLNIPGILGDLLQKGLIPGGAAFFNGSLNVHYHGEGVIYIDNLDSRVRIAIRVLQEDCDPEEWPWLARCFPRVAERLPGKAQLGLVSTELLDLGVTSVFTFYSIGMYTGIYAASLDNAKEELPFLGKVIAWPPVKWLPSLAYSTFWYATAMLHLLPASEASRITLSLFGGIANNAVAACNIDSFSEVNKQRFIRFYSERMVKEQSAVKFDHMLKMFTGFINEHLPRLASGGACDDKTMAFLNRIYTFCKKVRLDHRSNKVIHLSPEDRWEMFSLFAQIEHEYQDHYDSPGDQVVTRWDIFIQKALPEIVYTIVVLSLIPLFAVAFSYKLALALVFMTILINLVFGKFAANDFVRSWFYSEKDKIFRSYIHFYDDLDKTFSRVFGSFFFAGIFSCGTSLKLYLEEIGVLLPLWLCVLWAIPTAVGTWWFNLTGFGPILFKWLFRQPDVRNFLKQEGLTEDQITQLEAALSGCETVEDFRNALFQFYADMENAPSQASMQEVAEKLSAVFGHDVESPLAKPSVSEVLAKDSIDQLNRREIIELHAMMESLTSAARTEITNACAEDNARLLHALESVVSSTVTMARRSFRQMKGYSNLSCNSARRHREVDWDWKKSIPEIIEYFKMNVYGEAKRLLFAGGVKSAALWTTYCLMINPHSLEGVAAFCAAGFSVDFLSGAVSRAKRSVRQQGHRDSGKHWSQAMLSQLTSGTGAYSAVPTTAGAFMQLVICGYVMYTLKEEKVDLNWDKGPISPRMLFILNCINSLLLSVGWTNLNEWTSSPCEPVDFSGALTACGARVFDALNTAFNPITLPPKPVLRG